MRNFVRVACGHYESMARLVLAAFGTFGLTFQREGGGKQCVRTHYKISVIPCFFVVFVFLFFIAMQSCTFANHSKILTEGF